MFTKTNKSASIHSSVDQHEKVKDLLKAIDGQFVTSDKALASTLIVQFSSLKALKVTMLDFFLIHYILCTLPMQYFPFKISHNTHSQYLIN